MKLILLRILLFIILFFSFNRIYAGDTEQECIDQANYIDEKLACLESIKFKEIKSGAYGWRHFEIAFKQLADHERPVNYSDSLEGVFEQRLALLHRDTDAPMVLQTSGYSIFSVQPTALANLFGANQLQVEHRYFSNSRPTNLDWSKLNIKQSADDFHAITMAFKKIYKQKWVGTGASKGGMTSVYHRYFYPQDLDGTLADVAPLSFSTSDERYADFIKNVGGAEYSECREKLKNMQIRLLENRESYIPQLSGDFSQLGSVEIAYEHSVIESVFYFWQYEDPNLCDLVPNQDVDDMFDFLQSIASIDDYSDNSINQFIPYYYQAATQLGNPANALDHLRYLLHFDMTIDQYTPKGVSYFYSNDEMLKVEEWVKQYADKIIFVYGELDPWTAGEFPASTTGLEIFKYYVPKGNHGAKFTALNASDKAQAIDTLTRWMGKPPNKKQIIMSTKYNELTLEDIEFEIRKKYKLK